MTKKILLADDEVVMTEIVAVSLGMEDGYEFITAEDGKQAVQMTLEEHPDLILLDVDMPNMDGLEACRRIKADPTVQSTPLIMLSAMAQASDVAAGFEAGADDYMTKPFSPADLLSKIRTALRDSLKIGRRVFLRDGRVGKVLKRVQLSDVMLDPAYDNVTGYHVEVDDGHIVLVPSSELTPLEEEED